MCKFADTNGCIDCGGECKDDHPSAASAGSLADLVPTNWLDPLLTGPDKVLPAGSVFGPTDIENLLRAVRQRIKDAESK